MSTSGAMGCTVLRSARENKGHSPQFGQSTFGLSAIAAEARPGHVHLSHVFEEVGERSRKLLWLVKEHGVRRVVDLYKPSIPDRAHFRFLKIELRAFSGCDDEHRAIHLRERRASVDGEHVCDE